MKLKKCEMVVYEYTIIRLVPKVERGEFINIGILLFCKEKKTLLADFYLNEQKLNLFESDLAFEDIFSHVQSFISIAKATASNNPVATFDVAERFRWLAATKSSCIQTSPTHCGITANLEQTFDQLFKELIL